MPLVGDVKFSCQACVKGHRSANCPHTDRPLVEVKKKGRPPTQCEDCRELRKTRALHVKCACITKAEAPLSLPHGISSDHLVLTEPKALPAAPVLTRHKSLPSSSSASHYLARRNTLASVKPHDLDHGHHPHHHHHGSHSPYPVVVGMSRSPSGPGLGGTTAVPTTTAEEQSFNYSFLSYVQAPTPTPTPLEETFEPTLETEGLDLDPPFHVDAAEWSQVQAYIASTTSPLSSYPPSPSSYSHFLPSLSSEPPLPLSCYSSHSVSDVLSYDPPPTSISLHSSTFALSYDPTPTPNFSLPSPPSLDSFSNLTTALLSTPSAPYPASTPPSSGVGAYVDSLTFSVGWASSEEGDPEWERGEWEKGTGGWEWEGEKGGGEVDIEGWRKELGEGWEVEGEFGIGGV